MTQTRANHRLVPPRQADAEPVCLLDAAWAARRQEPPDAFLAAATSQSPIEGGAEFRFATTPDVWRRIDTFVAEEGECCPFFAFERWQEGGEAVLRIYRPQGSAS